MWVKSVLLKLEETPGGVWCEQEADSKSGKYYVMNEMEKLNYIILRSKTSSDEYITFLLKVFHTEEL